MLACGVLVLNACKKDRVVQPKGVAYVLEQNSKIKWKGKAADGNFNEGTIDVKGTTNSEGFDFEVLSQEIINGKFTIPVSSIDVTNLPPNLKPVLENHLKTADFFYMLLHPNVTVKIISGVPSTFSGVDANYLIKGEMTLLGSTHPIEFPAKVLIADGKLNIKAKFTFNQSTWGMNYHLDGSYPAADRLVAGIDVEFDLTGKIK